MQLIEYAKELASSGLLPADFKKNPANILYAMEIAKDLDVSPVTAIRGIYVLNGKVGFSAQFMLAMANRSGAIQSIDYHVEGSGDDLTVTAEAVLRGGVAAQETASMRMAIAEGWTRNPKYKTMPVQMLKKRALRMLIDNYCPEVMCGLGAGEPEDYEETAPIQIARDPVTPIPIRPHAKTRAMLERVIRDPSLANAEAIAAEIEESEPDEIPAAAPPLAARTLDLNSATDRALVTDVAKRIVKETGWLSLHRSKLEDHFKANKTAAEPKAIEDAICSYLRASGEGKE